MRESCTNAIEMRSGIRSGDRFGGCVTYADMMSASHGRIAEETVTADAQMVFLLTPSAKPNSYQLVNVRAVGLHAEKIAHDMPVAHAVLRFPRGNKEDTAIR